MDQFFHFSRDAIVAGRVAHFFVAEDVDPDSCFMEFNDPEMTGVTVFATDEFSRISQCCVLSFQTYG